VQDLDTRYDLEGAHEKTMTRNDPARLGPGPTLTLCSRDVRAPLTGPVRYRSGRRCDYQRNHHPPV
ncbi:hypothetical protein, partial [Jatrophihabitans endophyticus]|uniref:hypothetical protein n=1 Tax=Jatrophihabitans endophyticus TaxID=1206085 RepID=UPI0026F17764